MCSREGRPLWADGGSGWSPKNAPTWVLLSAGLSSRRGWRNTSLLGIAPEARRLDVGCQISS